MYLTVLKFILSPVGLRILAVVGFAIALFFAYQWIYQRGYHAAEIECSEERADALAEAIERKDKLESESAAATESLQDRLAEELPAIEESTHEATERIRIVYRDVPVPADCSRPPDVMRELEAARSRANAAASELRGRDSGATPPDSD